MPFYVNCTYFNMMTTYFNRLRCLLTFDILNQTHPFYCSGCVIHIHPSLALPERAARSAGMVCWHLISGFASLNSFNNRNQFVFPDSFRDYANVTILDNAFLIHNKRLWGSVYAKIHPETPVFIK